MTKKLSMLLAAAAVAAFAVPAAASAAPEITVNGVKAPVGTAINGSSANTTWKTEFGNFTCGTVSFSGEVTANTGTTMKSVANGPLTTASCFFKGTTPFTIDDMTLTSIHSATAGKGTASLTYTATQSGLACHFANSALPFTYPSKGNTIVLSGNLTASPASCGDTAIETTFTLTSPGGAVILH